VLFSLCVQTCLQRAMGRVDSSGARRSDDDPEVFKKRSVQQPSVECWVEWNCTSLTFYTHISYTVIVVAAHLLPLIHTHFVCSFVMPSHWVHFRYRTYITQTMPIIHRFEEKGLVRRLSAVQGPEEASRVHSQHCYGRQLG